MNKSDKISFRIFFVAALFVVACIVFLVRMINIGSGAEPMEEYTFTYERREPIPAVRGEIYDRNGNVLATNITTYRIFISPSSILSNQQEANKNGENVDYAGITAYLDKGFERAKALGVKKVVFGSGGARSFPEGYSFEKGDGQTISQIIDWDYKFKAIDSINNEGKMNNRNWNPQWSVQKKVPDNIWDERVE